MSLPCADQAPQDIPFRTFTEGTPAALATNTQIYRTRNTVIEQAVITMMQECKDDLRKDWGVAKARLGAAQAGKTLEDFARMNTKVSLSFRPSVVAETRRGDEAPRRRARRVEQL